MTLAWFNADSLIFFIKGAISHHRTQAQANYYSSTFTKNESESKAQASRASIHTLIPQRNANTQKKENQILRTLRQIYLLCKLNS